MNKIIVIGSTGSGKSTLATRLAQKLNIPYIQLDQLFWKADWQESSDEEFFPKIEAAIKAPSWVLDGNYARSNHLTWKDADTVIWIDLPFWTTFWQNLWRSLGRSLWRKELWPGTGNRESLARLFSKDSILRWLFKTYDLNVQRYQERMRDPRFAHLKFYRLHSRRQVENFLDSAGGA